jgi:Holliday junction resolvase-like predicted endonuclease
MSNKDQNDILRQKPEPLFDQRDRTSAALPFKEPDQSKIVLVPEQTSIKLVVTEDPAPVQTTTDVKPATSTAIDHAVERAIAASLGGPGISTPYQSTEALKVGLVGERLAVEALAQQGHHILDYKPDIAGTNQGGIDIVTMKDGIVYLIDNKAYRTGRNVGSVSALEKNFEKNLAAVREKFEAFAADPTRNAAQRSRYGAAVEAIDNGNYQKAVATATIAPDGKHSSGLTAGLQGRDNIIVLSLDPSLNTGPAPILVGDAPTETQAAQTTAATATSAPEAGGAATVTPVFDQAGPVFQPPAPPSGGAPAPAPAPPPSVPPSGTGGVPPSGR